MEEKAKLKTTILVAMNQNNVIGNNNSLLYHIKDDLKRFKSLTEGNVVIMGRKTFESLPNKQALSNRINIILTNNREFFVESEQIPENTEVYIVNSLNDLIDLVSTLLDDKKIFVIGGRQIYKLFLDNDLVENIEMTYIDDNMKGDCHFPLLDNNAWDRKSTTEWIKDSASAINYQFIHLTKKNK